jgi:predicted transcriptional regulator
MRKTKATDLHAGKTLRWAGATRILTASSRPKFLGVAPARHAGSVTVFCPRAYKDVSNRECVEETIRNKRKEKVSMAVLKAAPKQPKTTVVQLRLDDEVKLKLSKYAEFLDCSPSYVVTEALKLVYRKDKEFQSWLSGQHTETYEPTSKTVSKGASLKGESFQLELK